MISVNTHEAKSRLSELIELVISGQEKVVICRNGKPLIDLVVHEQEREFPDPLQVRPHLAKVKLLGDPTAPVDDDAWPEEFR